MQENRQFVKVIEDTRIEVGAFYNGEVRNVADETAGLLIGNGWAVATEVELPDETDRPTPETVVLEVDNSRMGTKAKEAS